MITILLSYEYDKTFATETCTNVAIRLLMNRQLHIAWAVPEPSNCLFDLACLDSELSVYNADQKMFIKLLSQPSISFHSYQWLSCLCSV